MAMLAPALPYLAAGSMAMGALGSIQQGQAAAASDKYNSQVAANNAQIATNNATLAGQAGAANAEQAQMKTRAQVGSIKAAQAANGINVNKGSAVDVQSSASELGELNAITIRSNAVKQAYGYQTQAASDMAQSQLDKSQAKYDASAGYTKAATGLLSSASTASQMGMFDSTATSGATVYQPNNVGPFPQ